MEPTINFKAVWPMVKEHIKENVRRKFTFIQVGNNSYHVFIGNVAYYCIETLTVGKNKKILSITPLFYNTRNEDVDTINIVRDFARLNHPEFTVSLVRQAHVFLFREYGYDDLVKTKIGIGKGYIIPEHHMSKKKFIWVP